MVKRTCLGLLAGLVSGLMIVGSVAAATPVRARATGGDPPAADCQPFAGRPCLLPFPNNLFTRHDRSSPTGLRVSLPQGAMPVNTSGQRVSAAPYDRADGFSPGSAAIVHVPGLDNAEAFARTGAAGLLDMAGSLGEEPADRDHRRAHRPAAADLVRARRERQDAGDAQTC